MKRLVTLAAAFGLLALWGELAVAQPRKLTGAEIAKLLSGHTLASPPDKGQSVQRFEPNGTTFYKSEEKELQGRWKIVGDKYCSSWDENSASKCADVYVDPPRVVFVGEDGAQNLWVMAK